MRRGLSFLSLGLLVLGLETATESVSLTLGRLRAGLAALYSGTPVHVGVPRFVFGVVCLALGLLLWVLLFWSARLRREVATAGNLCPACGGTTRRVRRRGWQRVLSAVLGQRLARRKCDACGWVGLATRS